jgi:hypothetical protein
LTRLGSLAGSCPQVQTDRDNYACERIPVEKYLQADKSLFPHPLSTLSGALPPAAERSGAGRPHKKIEKKEVTEAPGSPLSVFTILSLISSTFSFGIKK